MGIDVVDIVRFEASLKRTPGLRARLFTEDERRLPPRSLAARFAAKEALAKALGAPRGLVWTDAEVRRAPDGRPGLHVEGTVAAAAARLGVTSGHISPTPHGRVGAARV